MVICAENNPSFIHVYLHGCQCTFVADEIMKSDKYCARMETVSFLIKVTLIFGHFAINCP